MSIVVSNGVNITNSGYSKDDLRVRSFIYELGGPISTALNSAEKRGFFRPLYDPRKPYAGFEEAYSAGWNHWDKDGLGNFLMNATAVGVGAPLLASSPIIPGLLSRGGLKAGLLKTGISASTQLAINQQINLVGALADGIMLPGVGDFVGAAFDGGFNMKTNSFYSNTIMQNKSLNQALFQGATSTLFSAKTKGLDGLVLGINNYYRSLYQMPNSFANYTLQKHGE